MMNLLHRLLFPGKARQLAAALAANDAAARVIQLQAEDLHLAHQQRDRFAARFESMQEALLNDMVGADASYADKRVILRLTAGRLRDAAGTYSLRARECRVRGEVTSAEAFDNLANAASSTARHFEVATPGEAE